MITILAWKIPWTEEPGGLQSLGSQRVGHNWAHIDTHCSLCTWMHAKLLQLYITLCDPVDCSPPGSSVHEILQERILVWVAMPSSRASFWPRNWTYLSWDSCIAGGFFTTESPGKSTLLFTGCYIPHKNLWMILLYLGGIMNMKKANETFMERILTIKIPKVADWETTNINDHLGKWKVAIC